MKRLLSIVLCVMLAFCISACGKQKVSFDPETEGIVDVALQTAYGSQKHTQYNALSAKGVMEIKSFEPDDMETYQIPSWCFESYVEENKVRNRLVTMELLDAQGAQVEISDAVEGIFHCLEELENGILRIKLFKLADVYLVYVELKVNLWTPCDLYYYEPQESKLHLLHEWDNMEVKGIHIRDLSRIQ